VNSNCTVHIGSCVRVREPEGEEEYTIVGDRPDIAANRISPQSPLAEALLGHAAGDEVKVRAPGGLRAVTIVRVAF